MRKLSGLKTTLWTCLAVVFVIVFLNHFQAHWQMKLPLLSQIIYGLFAFALLFSIQFNRSRITLLIGLMLAYHLIIINIVAGKAWLVAHHQWAYVASLFTFAWLTMIKDRGLLSVHGIIRCLGFGLCVLLAKLWLMLMAWLSVYNAQKGLIPFEISAYSLAIPLYGVASFVLYKSLRAPNLFIASLFTSLVFITLLYQKQMEFELVALMCVVSLQYIVVVVIDSYFLAYRDELTSLPSRRALNQYALSLGRRYCVAMIDIDHFKKFNDTYGHDIGDQVLKLVAAKLAKISKGGRVFRYGGEEFTAIFPSKTAENAFDELERLRGLVADYKIVIRHPVRKDKKARQKQQANDLKTVSVTISIGVASREAKQSFEQTIKQADLALYRAKKNGRNNVSY